MKRMIYLSIFVFMLAGCLPDRMPPLPVEQERPMLLNVLSPQMVELTGIEDETELRDSILVSQTGFSVSVDSPIVLSFDDMMDLSTFDGNVLLYTSDGDTVQNLSFQFAGIDSSIDTVVTSDSTDTTITIDTVYTYLYRIEHPTLNSATEYFLKIFGGIKDTSGNSMSIEPDFELLYEFFTEGLYSRGITNEMPRVFVSDITAHQVFVIDTLRSSVFTTEVERPTGFATYDGTELLISDKSTPGPYLPIFDFNTGAKIDSIDTGGDQVGLAQAGYTAVTASRTPRQLSLIDLSVDTVVEQVQLGFAPIVVGHLPGFGFVGDALGNVYIYDFVNHEWNDTLENVFTRGSRSRHLVTGEDVIYANDYNSNTVKVLSLSGNSEVQLPEGTHPVDVAAMQYLYAAGEDGLILKYSSEGGSYTLVDSTDIGTSIASIDIAPRIAYNTGGSVSEELIYLMLPELELRGHTGFVGIMDARTLHLVRVVPVSATASEVWVSP